MKKMNILYWIVTGLLIPAFGIGSVLAIAGVDYGEKVFRALGYPLYLAAFLGVARLLALIAILSPGFDRLKEWAYAGLVFDLIGAIYSILSAGFPIAHIINPLIVLALLVASYYLYHRRLKLKAAIARMANY